MHQWIVPPLYLTIIWLSGSRHRLECRDNATSENCNAILTFVYYYFNWIFYKITINKEISTDKLKNRSTLVKSLIRLLFLWELLPTKIVSVISTSLGWVGWAGVTGRHWRRACFRSAGGEKSGKREDVHVPAVNLASIRRTEELREKMAQIKEKRRINKLLGSVLLPVSGLALSSETLRSHFGLKEQNTAKSNSLWPIQLKENVRFSKILRNGHRNFYKSCASTS